MNIQNYYPIISTKLADNSNLQMPRLLTYVLYANATIAEPNFLSVRKIEFTIDGINIPVIYENDTYTALWTPRYFGPTLIYVKATASNRNVKIDTIHINVSSVIANTDVQTFQNNFINIWELGTQTFQGSYKLPQSVGAFNKIMANFSISCPPGGCDPYDRLAYVEYKAPNGRWLELFRYITPFGISCEHSIDLSDYESVLQGNTELRLYKDTWAGGWKFDLRLSYTAGDHEYLYSDVDEVWYGNYPFGDMANLQPVDVAIVKKYDNIKKLP